MPEEVKRATEDYRTEQDILGSFIEDCCVVDRFATATVKDLYAAFSAWCERNGEHAVAQRSFGMRLAERGFERGKGSGGVRIWKGIKLSGF